MFVATAPAGVTINEGVLLAPAMVHFLRVLRAAVPAEVPLHVTSGTRDVHDQARAMLAKLAAGGPGELLSTYRDDDAIRQLLALPSADVSSWAEQIRQLASAGRYLSRHLSGMALDLRTRNLTTDQVAAVSAAVKSLGGRALYEGTPPHLHVDLPTRPPPSLHVPNGAPSTGSPTAGSSNSGTPSSAASWGALDVGLAVAVAGTLAWLAWPVVLPVATSTSHAAWRLLGRVL